MATTRRGTAQHLPALAFRRGAPQVAERPAEQTKIASSFDR
jgi:hypothetical protein